ncbi:hypothetical protein NM208_g4489 [Fusarium decemcellulare]|uniref:Uncharacterized protein n=1 Tax=Fusarium decemcellulare TaxID=57161 RepID=A0ACC1SKN8_9HYPO|nr:hypothetical protein NM208_g4489 [Fusarium decemcellulare]
MAKSSTIAASFEVTSGAICFGSLTNILRGAETSIQPAPNPRPHLTGTVISHPQEFNIPAKKGIWNAYTLLEAESSRVEGWFVAHEDVDPLPELLKILRVAGSPYEVGHITNSDETRAQGVLLINRYDWGYYAGDDELDEVEEEGDILANSNTIGLVDHAHGYDHVQRWTRQKPSQRDSSPHGIWMYIPDPEYMWGRFGFDDEYEQARSFLFFTQRTDFTKTKFPRQSQPLRKYETELEAFHRGLEEGTDYSGVKRLRELCGPPGYLPRPSPGVQMPEQPPPESELLGPYSKSERILLDQDIEALRASVSSVDEPMKETFRHRGMSEEGIAAEEQKRRTGIFVDPWKEPTFDLFNELVLSYLEHFVLPHRSHSTPSTLGPVLFPNRKESIQGRKHIDDFLFQQFSGPNETVPGFDVPSVRVRILEFLNRRAGTNPVAFNEECLEGIVRVFAALIKEMVELADRYAFGRGDKERAIDDSCVIVPQHIREAVYFDNDLLSVLRYSAVFWAGRK